MFDANSSVWIAVKKFELSKMRVLTSLSPKSLGVTLIALSASLWSAEAACAAAQKQTLNIAVTINYGCSLAVSDMDFGTITTVTGSETATSNVTVNCTPGALYLLSFSPSSWTTTRSSAMSNPSSAKINFNMALSGIWGVGSGTTAINGQLAATPGAQTGAYKSVETLYVIY
jgi:spore coat protein U-like protein